MTEVEKREFMQFLQVFGPIAAREPEGSGWQNVQDLVRRELGVDNDYIPPRDW